MVAVVSVSACVSEVGGWPRVGGCLVVVGGSVC